MQGSEIRIAVTGRPGCGKTTLIRRVVDAVAGTLTIGGIYTEEIRRRGARTGFAIIDIATGRRGILARAGRGPGPRVGKYRVSLRGIEEIAIPAIEDACRVADLVVIDEIAPMELTSPRFADAVGALLETPKPLVVAIHGKAGGPLLSHIRATFRLYEVTPGTRDELVEVIAAQIRGRESPRQEAEASGSRPKGGETLGEPLGAQRTHTRQSYPPSGGTRGVRIR